ncbi:MAG: hypothetical protein LBN39_10090 [Planctomycetaceae bacterium]|nr:hypothetical protein [Planctomycetaceae bacterium]
MPFIHSFTLETEVAFVFVNISILLATGGACPPVPMYNTMKLQALTLAVLLFCSAAVIGAEQFAEQNLAEELYGRGVHAFFDSNYKGSIELLSKAEQLGSTDPRAYFYLALSGLRLNKRGDADAYFKKAAQLEQEGKSARDYNVSAAISRIQGVERLLVERYRRQAKQNWENTEKKRKELMYAAEKAKDEAIVKSVGKAPVATAPFGARSIDPFAKPEPKTEPKKEEKPDEEKPDK